MPDKINSIIYGFVNTLSPMLIVFCYMCVCNKKIVHNFMSGENYYSYIYIMLNTKWDSEFEIVI